MEIDEDGVYYRALKDSFLWRKGAILEDDGDQVLPINGLEIWNMVPNQDEYISSPVIAHSPEWFERVYPLKGKGDNMLLANAEETKKEVEYHFPPITIKS
jgi:hypothetical protein